MAGGSGAETIAVVGAGSWGTALAIQFARTGRRTLLWGRAEDDPAELERSRENARYLPGARFPDTLHADGDLAAVLAAAPLVVVAVPSHALRPVLTSMKPLLRPDARLAWATKGFELESGKLPHQVAREVLGSGRAMAVLSGPTFAREVGMGLPTAMTVAATDPDYARQLAESLSGESFRAYMSSDIVGVEVGGAVKNVLAIGAGICDGLGFGANTRIALITRGLVEMTRLGVALGADAGTFMGLAGMGDLVLTCTDDQSRNRRMGLALAAGKTVKEAEAEIQQVVEGVLAAEAVHRVAREQGVEMPICEQLYRILYQGAEPREAVATLMKRELKPEFAPDS
ncbi:NAD(P)H-dependent glycerol-3-phosphate dehydrogenase [Thioalkalivibrio sp. XN8]|uniref:NAD(P)H-dependent glycerol-3-phosphate dehydrogenase n=1 Tax=Thioalkalivibrio sp. XN8 TaxID=2712863 RepID=UPI0013EA2285|nr:NAD(P)H-dependent glycerol-3-phosphate dehydrogenase [Thioalkalivibrio sp. XN8]NGP52070.1 NAD(P)-dependent glycerol-3-phosphate dehydrogenase [Thioalkalivibrio sp. XN8]